MSAARIFKTTDVPTPTVRRWIKSEEPQHDTHPRSGWPVKLSSRDVRHLVRAVTSSKDDRQASCMKIAGYLEIQASVSTIPLALRKAGFRRCVACPKPLISWINRRKRLKWAREHLSWQEED